MADTGLIYATSCANDASFGAIAWANPSNAVGNNTNDATYAEAVSSFLDRQSNYLIGTINHGLTAADRIDGIEFAFRRYYVGSTTTVSDTRIYLVRNGDIQTGTNKALTQAFPKDAGDWSTTVGGSTDLWGQSSLNGGHTLAFAVSSNSGNKDSDARITAFRATIYYTEDAAEGDAGTGRMITMFF